MAQEYFMYWGTSPEAQTFGVPYPDEAPYEGQDIVDSARSVTGAVVGTQIGRTQEKQSMTWAYIEPEKWYAMNRWIRDNGKFFYARFFSYVYGEWVVRHMYVGDVACEPHLVTDSDTGAKYIKNASLNIIDMGY